MEKTVKNQEAFYRNDLAYAWKWQSGGGGLSIGKGRDKAKKAELQWRNLEGGMLLASRKGGEKGREERYMGAELHP